MRLLARVDLLVIAVTRLFSEALAAQRTAEGPLSRVAQLVGFEFLRLTEALSALGATERLLARVQPLVRAEVVRFGETLRAVCAGVRFLPRVDELVPFQVTGLPEALPTLGASVRPLAGVDALVSLQVTQGAEALPALSARERLLTSEVARFAWPVAFCAGLVVRSRRFVGLDGRQFVKVSRGEIRVHFPHAVDDGLGPELVELGSQLRHVDGLQGVHLGLDVAGHEVGFVLGLDGAELAGVVAVQVRMLLRLDVLQAVRDVGDVVEHQAGFIV